MASLIPALSEKAQDELLTNLPRIAKEDLDENTFRCGFMFLDCFQDLFDLEKYPITWEQLCEYLSKSPYYERAEAGSHVFFRCLGWKHKSITKTTNIAWVLKRLINLTGKRDIDIIGDIHGWWEKPQTY